MRHDFVEKRTYVAYACFHLHRIGPIKPDFRVIRGFIAEIFRKSRARVRNVGFSYQKARFVSDHLNEAKRLEWRHTRWPKILRQAKPRKALLLFGAEASLAPWGSLRSTGAPTGQHPEVPTSGNRQGYKGFGLIDSVSGRLVYTGHEGRLNAESDAAFRLDVLSQTRRHVVGMQAGARSHTSHAMQDFVQAHTARLTIAQLPSYSPDFHPSEHLWKKGKKEATHVKYCPDFAQ